MKTLLAILLALAIVGGNVLLGYYYAPSEILFTPVVALLVTRVLLAATVRPGGRGGTVLLGSATLAAGFICLNDVGVKLYGGGTHDAEGLGFVNFFLLIGALLAYGLVVHHISRQKATPLPARIAAGLLFPALLALHLYFFADLGYGLHNDCRYGCAGTAL